MEQVRALDTALRARNDNLVCCWVEGDSVDATWQQLHMLSEGLNRNIAKKDHGGPRYGPVVDQRRFLQKSLCDNAAFELVPPNGVNAVCYVEGDLIWQPSTIIALCDMVLNGLDMVCPLIMCRTYFRDTWAYRHNGTKFRNTFPYHECIKWEQPIIEIDSCGSCFAMKPAIAKIPVPQHDEWVAWCEEIRKKNYHIHLAHALSVLHP